jgi:hypothetical protein
MPCTALFELTFGSLTTYLPELRLCPKILVFERLGIPNLKLLQLPNHTELMGSVRHGLSPVTTIVDLPVAT